jgi:NAD(P)-dependent dehydrogenase (short-subunit alcohol dehydrogenase family)
MSEQHNSFGISGRVAVVTGGNRNIGRSIVLTLAKEGVTTIVLYRDGADEAKKVCAEVAAIGAKSAMYQADLAYTTSLASLVGKI